MLSTKTSGRLILGSANFTRAGLTSNAELADVFDFELDGRVEFRRLFQDAFNFVSSLADGCPSQTLASNVGHFLHTTPWLQGVLDPEITSIRLLHNLEHSLWDQIMSIVPRPVDRIHIVSRFFDASPLLIDRVIRDFGPERLFIYTQNGLTTMTADWLDHSCIKSGRAEVLLCTYEDGRAASSPFTPRLDLRIWHHQILVTAVLTSPARLSSPTEDPAISKPS